MSKKFTAEEVSSHKTPDSLFIIVDEDVYDVTKFADEHPGGKKSKSPTPRHVHPFKDMSDLKF